MERHPLPPAVSRVHRHAARNLHHVGSPTPRRTATPTLSKPTPSSHTSPPPKRERARRHDGPGAQSSPVQRALEQTLRHTVAELDGSGRLLQVRPAWTELLGWSADDTNRRALADFAAPLQRRRLFGMVLRATRSSMSAVDEHLTFLDAGGQACPLRLSLVSLGAAAGTLVALRAPVATDALPPAPSGPSLDLGPWLRSYLSHRVRTPLTAITGHAALLAPSDAQAGLPSGPDPAALGGYLASVTDSIAELAAESVQTAPRARSWVDLYGLLKDAAQAPGSFASPEQQSVLVEADTSLTCWAWAHRGRLRLLIMVLVDYLQARGLRCFLALDTDAGQPVVELTGFAPPSPAVMPFSADRDSQLIEGAQLLMAGMGCALERQVSRSGVDRLRLHLQGAAGQPPPSILVWTGDTDIGDVAVHLLDRMAVRARVVATLAEVGTPAEQIDLVLVDVDGVESHEDAALAAVRARLPLVPVAALAATGVPVQGDWALVVPKPLTTERLRDLVQTHCLLP